MNRMIVSLAILIGLAAPAVAEAPPDAVAVTIPAFVDAGPQEAAPPAVASAPTVSPADKLPNPVDDPFAAIETLKAQKKQGWAVTILGAIVMLTMGLSRAAVRWPTSKLLAWFATNKTAIYITSSVGLVGAAAFNALALGGTWMAAAYTGAGAFFTLVHPGTPKA